MDKRLMAAIICSMMVLALILACAYRTDFDSSNRTELNASTEGPLELSDVVKDIKRYSYYDGYDNETLEWMESMGSKSVFFSSDAIIVMNTYDGRKLHSESVTDAYITQTFSCNVQENRTLVDGNHTMYVLYVENVKYIGEEIHFLQGGD